MCGVAEPLQATAQFTTVAGQREYSSKEGIPADIDELFAVWCAANTSFQLDETDIRVLNRGVKHTGIPRQFYRRRYAMQVGNQQSDGTITVSNTNPQPGDVIGLEPIPSAAYQVTIYYYPRHYKLIQNSDVPIAIPSDYHRGIIAYAVSLGKEKEAALAESDRWMAKFAEYAGRLKTKQIQRGVLSKFPTAKIRDEDAEPFGTFTVYEAHS
jgi:hypothetical protein